MHLLVYDKHKEESFEVRDGAILNDMCGNASIPFCPQNVVGSNILLSLLPAEKIVEMAEENPSILKHPQLMELTGDSNPVLMVVYCKEKV